MTGETTGFARQISAVSPLEGDALDGSPRPKPKRQVQRREYDLDRSLTYFCSNPQCDHATWAPAEQARHMAQEFWEVAQELVRLAPDSLIALKLTGGVILRDLTDDQCRRAATDYARYFNRKLPVPVDVRLRAYEYKRRSGDGELESLDRSEWAPRARPEKCKRGHEFTPENTCPLPGGRRACRTCRREAGSRRYREDPEYRERRLQQQKTPEARARKNELQRQLRAANPERYREYKRQAALRKKQEAVLDGRS